MGVGAWFYAIWDDGLSAVEHNRSSLPARERRIVLLLLFSVAQGLNLSTLLIALGPWLKTGLITPDLGLGSVLNNLIMGLGVYIAPFVVLNYVMVFRNGRHKRLIGPRPGPRKPGWLFMGYFLLSSCLFLGLLIIAKAIS